MRILTLARATALTLAAFVAITAVALGAGSRAGATRAAERHAITYIKRYGIALRRADLDVQCAKLARSRWRCFVYANDGQCAGTLIESYARCTRGFRPKDVLIGCGE